MRLALLVMILSTLLFSCGSPAQSRGQAVQRPITPETISLGGVKLGMTPIQVKQLWGEPSKITILHGVGLPAWVYAEQDMEVGFSAVEGIPNEVVLITAGPQSRLKTQQGVGVGSSIEDVISAYGAVELVSETARASFLVEGGTVVRIVIEHRF